MKKYWLSIMICFLLIPSLTVSAFGNASVYVEMEYVIIRPSDDGNTAVMHMTTVKNLLDQEYKGEENSKTVLTIHIPKQATKLQVHDNSLGMVETDLGFTTTKAIPAKESLVIPYSYWLDKNTQQMELKYSYPVQGIQLLVPENMGSLNLEGLEYTIEGLFEFEGQNYYGYNLNGINANQSIKVVYDPTKQPSPEEIQKPAEENAAKEGTGADNPAVGNITHEAPVFHNPGHIRMWYQSPLSGFEPHILMIVLGVILFGGIGYYSYFRWKNKLAEDKRLSDREEQAFLQLIAKRKTIMDKIVELEENYSGGQISDQDYQTKLDAYKHHLLQVKLNLQKYTE
jgi:hypothetical protein